MDPGPLGASGVVAVSRAAQDKCLADALALFLPSAVENPVRVLNRREESATSHVVSFEDALFVLLHCIYK